MCPKKIKIKETALIVEGELAAEDLIYAAVSFSLTIAVHFYGTMIAGIFCIGIVFGFLKGLSSQDLWQELSQHLLLE